MKHWIQAILIILPSSFCAPAASSKTVYLHSEHETKQIPLGAIVLNIPDGVAVVCRRGADFRQGFHSRNPLDGNLGADTKSPLSPATVHSGPAVCKKHFADTKAHYCTPK